LKCIEVVPQEQPPPVEPFVSQGGAAVGNRKALRQHSCDKLSAGLHRVPIPHDAAASASEVADNKHFVAADKLSGCFDRIAAHSDSFGWGTMRLH